MIIQLTTGYEYDLASVEDARKLQKYIPILHSRGKKEKLLNILKQIKAAKTQDPQTTEVLRKIQLYVDVLPPVPVSDVIPELIVKSGETSASMAVIAKSDDVRQTPIDILPPDQKPKGDLIQTITYPSIGSSKFRVGKSLKS